MNQLEIISAVRPKRTSRDEMNLAEFPLTVLSTRTDPNIKTLEFKDHIHTRDGQILQRSWIITGADKFGLPTSSDDEVLLGLLKLTVDREFRDRKVYFTRYELLKILRWTTEGRSYTRLQKALDRLSGVRIKATNAFYENDNKCHSTRNFGIIDAYEINDGRTTETKPSFFAWSEVIFRSFQAGFIKKLDLEFYLDLKSAVSKRLYRYFDKHFWRKAQLDIDLFVLAHEKIGISRNYKFASALRQQLDPALEELVDKGFISSFGYSGLKARPTLSVAAAAPNARRAAIMTSEVVTENTTLKDTLKEALIRRGLKEPQVVRLLSAHDDAAMERVQRIVHHFDTLVASHSHLVSRSPVGFLYRAVEKPTQFILPGETSTVPKQPELNLKREAPPKPDLVQRSREAEYLIARRKEIDRLMLEVEPAVLSSISKEVEQGLQKVRAMVSATRFQEAVSHGVEQKLLELFRFPDIETWSAENKARHKEYRLAS